MTKKWLALLLSLVMVFSLTACGSSNNTPDEPDPGEGSGAQTEEKEFEAGTIDGDVYSSDVTGLKFTLGDNWVFLDDEAIEEVTGMVQDMTDDEALEEAMSQGASIYDMYAMVTDGSGRTANITVENLGALYGTILNESKYIDAVIDQLKPSFESMGATDVVVETATYSIAGVEHSGIHCAFTLQGVSLCEQMVCIKEGRYMYNITCVGDSEDAAAGVMAMFTAK